MEGIYLVDPKHKVMWEVAEVLPPGNGVAVPNVGLRNVVHPESLSWRSLQEMRAAGFYRVRPESS